MIEQLIEKMISEGKVTQVEIDHMVEEIKAEQPNTHLEVVSLEKRQTETENTVLFLMDMQMGGM